MSRGAKQNLVSRFFGEQMSVGGMTGTRAEYIDYLVDNCGWTRKQAVEIAAATKARK